MTGYMTIGEGAGLGKEHDRAMASRSILFSFTHDAMQDTVVSEEVHIEYLIM